MPRAFFDPSHHAVGLAVGAGDTEGAPVVGDAVGAGEVVGAGDGRAQLTPFTPTPHDVDAHKVLVNALLRLTSSSMHQPRSWSKAEAL